MTIVAAALGVRAFSFYEYSPWTRDGRITAYVIDSAAEVPGRVIEVAVQDNQFVHQGDLLYRIDPRDYEAAVKRTHADLDADRAQLALQRANVQRRKTVMAGAISAEEREVFATNVQADEAAVESARAALYKAQVDLERCEVRSPVNGYVTNLTVRAGNYANAGQRQMSVINADSYWITGYFEETRLRHIRAGARARAALMGYPNLEVAGHVESINRGIADTNTAPNPQGLPRVDPVSRGCAWRSASPCESTSTMSPMESTWRLARRAPSASTDPSIELSYRGGARVVLLLDVRPPAGAVVIFCRTYQSRLRCGGSLCIRGTESSDGKLTDQVASSSSGITPSVMQSKCKPPERVLVGHDTPARRCHTPPVQAWGRRSVSDADWMTSMSVIPPTPVADRDAGQDQCSRTIFEHATSRSTRRSPFWMPSDAMHARPGVWHHSCQKLRIDGPSNQES